MHAFEQGLVSHGHQVSYHDDDADVAVIWSVLWKGRMAKNKPVWDLYQNTNRPVVVLEVGAMVRGVFWRIGVNGIGQKSRFYPLGQNHDRARKIGFTPFGNYAGNGKNILIACQQTTSQMWDGQPDIVTWLTDVVARIQAHSDRPIVVRPHPREKISWCHPAVSIEIPVRHNTPGDDYNIRESIASSHCVINWNSNPGLVATVLGVPAIVGPDSLCTPLGRWDFSQIDNFETASSAQKLSWISDLVYTEWTEQEICQGVMVPQLVSYLESL